MAVHRKTSNGYVFLEGQGTQQAARDVLSMFGNDPSHSEVILKVFQERKFQTAYQNTMELYEHIVNALQHHKSVRELKDVRAHLDHLTFTNTTSTKTEWTNRRIVESSCILYDIKRQTFDDGLSEKVKEKWAAFEKGQESLPEKLYCRLIPNNPAVEVLQAEDTVSYLQKEIMPYLFRTACLFTPGCSRSWGVLVREWGYYIQSAQKVSQYFLSLHPCSVLMRDPSHFLPDTLEFPPPRFRNK